MSNPTDRKYAKSHEWYLPQGECALVGLTDFAQSELGDIVYVELPEVGAAVTAGASFGCVESVKTVSEILSPATGVVTRVNEALADTPEKINEAPFDTWLIEIGEIAATGELLDAAAYEATL